MTKNSNTDPMPQCDKTAAVSLFVCDECRWIGKREECKNESDFGYDQSCCPKCNNVMFDNLHGKDYAEKVGQNGF